jgi:hypothetical protein
LVVFGGLPSSTLPSLRKSRPSCALRWLSEDLPKDGRKGEEETSDERSVAAADQAGEYGRSAPEREAD